MNITLIGPSGAGKGTHAAKLVSQYDLLHLSTGDLLRENLRDRSALGLMAKKYMARGELVPDEVVGAMIEERLRRTSLEQGILFDGFPATSYQAEFLDELFKELGRELDAVVYLKVPDAEIVNRLSGRLICRKCQSPYHRHYKRPAKEGLCDSCGGELYQREDDNPHMVRVRLRVFHRVTGPLVDYYQRSGRLIVVEGEGEATTVQRAIIDALDAVQRQEQRAASLEEIQKIQALKAVSAPPLRVVYPSLDIVLLGGPGSGKGTQAEKLRQHLHIQHVATGDLFRENLKKETDLGRLAKAYMDRGELVPDDVTEAMVEERISRPDARDGFLLDGFPRTLPQAEALTDMLNDLQRRLAGVLYIKVSDEEIVNRLSGRFICRNCQTPFHMKFKPPAKPGVCDLCAGELYQRDDDNPKTIRARLKTFHAQTAPLTDFFQKTGLLTEIDGEGEVANVIARSTEAADRLAKAARG